MNTTPKQAQCPDELKARLWALVSESPLWPHAKKAVTIIKEKLAELWISTQEIEQIETT